MSENPRFKLKYDQLRAGNPAGKEDQDAPTDTAPQEDNRYLHPGYNRNLAVLWPDNRLEAFNYSYLVTIKYDPISEPNVLVLYFTSEVVTIKGYRLKPVFWDVFNGIARIIECIDPRYAQTLDETMPSITEISVERAG